MASKGSKKAKGLPKRYGKRAHKFAAYYSFTNPRRKLRHILDHNGHAAAKAWADARGILHILTEVIKARG